MLMGYPFKTVLMFIPTYCTTVWAFKIHVQTVSSQTKQRKVYVLDTLTQYPIILTHCIIIPFEILVRTKFHEHCSSAKLS